MSATIQPINTDYLIKYNIPIRQISKSRQLLVLTITLVVDLLLHGFLIISAYHYKTHIVTYRHIYSFIY